MLSRRNVRIKVMQLLFALGRDEELNFKELQKRYKKTVEDTFELFSFTISALIDISRHATQEMEIRKGKHLPSEDDKSFTDKFFSNEIIQSLISTKFIDDSYKKKDFASKLSKDFTKKIYTDISKTSVYKDYMNNASDAMSHREILLEAFRHCRKDEYFNEVMEDNYPSWVDDKSLIVGAVKKVFKAFPDAGNEYFDTLLPDKETVEEFGANLLKKSHKNDKALLEIIEPILNNWDSDRIAIVDMILMKMGVTELVHFSTIPTKVTLNEYVEIAKSYSTAKSKDFINGILDKIKTDLAANGKIAKEGRGLEE